MLLTNTLTKKKEEFVPIDKKDVKLYACGVTPYDYSHIGHGRSYVFIDLLVRFLKFLDFNVTYIRNVTDIDDKLLKKAEKAGDIMLYKKIAHEFTKLFQKEMKKLNCTEPDFEPKVTDNIDSIIEFIKLLVEKKVAYVVDGTAGGSDVYFDVTKYKNYGELSGKNLEDLQAGARVKVDERKKNPADFALWKGDKKFWDSPFGHGRPGWHIECSVLAKKFLGEQIDIHCGGADLVFPHHENERAQSESLHEKTFVKYWVHNALLNIDKKKMSKSLGNIFSLKEIFEKYDPMVLKFYFLQHQYRTPIEFSMSMLDSSKVAYKKLVKLFEGTKIDEKEKFTISSINPDEVVFVRTMIDALSDDLNTPKFLGILFENVSQIKSDEKTVILVKKILFHLLGLTLEELEEEKIEITPEIEELIKKRDLARKEKNWTEADKIRDQLKELGYEVQDRKI